jgi:PAS domain-containing protein
MNNEELNARNTNLLRAKAEEKLIELQKSSTQTILEVDMKRLMHELQVHQIELEMQNEELQEAYEISEAALKKYTILYDFSPMGYFTLNSDGNICDLNFTGAEMLGEKRIILINSNFKLFISDESKLVFNNFFNRVFTNNVKQSCKVMLGYDKNPLCQVYIEGVVTDIDRKCLLSVVDISGFNKQSNL